VRLIIVAVFFLGSRTFSRFVRDQGRSIVSACGFPTLRIDGRILLDLEKDTENRRKHYNISRKVSFQETVFEIKSYEFCISSYLIDGKQGKRKRIRKFPRKYHFELRSIRKSRIQQRTRRGKKVSSRNPAEDFTMRRKFVGYDRDLEDILRLKSSRASPNSAARQTVKLKYRSALSKYLCK